VSPTTVLWTILILGFLVLCFTVNATMNVIDAWSERREQNSSAEAETHMDAIKSMGRIQSAYFQAHEAMHDEAKRQR
jgi:hypothetical protein